VVAFNRSFAGFPILMNKSGPSWQFLNVAYIVAIQGGGRFWDYRVDLLNYGYRRSSYNIIAVQLNWSLQLYVKK